jgi:hypothetical protein
MEILRPLAARYGEIANLDVQKERLERYAKSNAMQAVRPVVLIDEVPWGEIDDKTLLLHCNEHEARELEQILRRSLYQWDRFQADYVIPPVFRVEKKIGSTGVGLEIEESQIESATGSYASSHKYVDQLGTEEGLDTLRPPDIVYDKEKTEREAELASEVFADLLPVEICGISLHYRIWDHISELRGVEHLLMDLAARPEFMHRTMKRFTKIATAMFDQYLEHGLVDTKPILLHCTPAVTDELPADDYTGVVRKKDVWGRGAAQIFSAVSPEMHDEFDLAYSEEIFGECGLLYYGCCEPLHAKIEHLRKRFKNLRKISITPWADPEVAAEKMGPDFVMAAKPNPAFVNSRIFNPEPVEKELRRYLDACRRNGTTCEFVLKDISTIAGNPENLTRWAETASRVVDEYC